MGKLVTNDVQMFYDVIFVVYIAVRIEGLVTGITVKAEVAVIHGSLSTTVGQVWMSIWPVLNDSSISSSLVRVRG